MMGLIRIRERGSTPRIMRREMNKHLRVSWQVTGQSWHRRFLEKHFTVAGAREYGYAPRRGEPGSGWVGNFWLSYTGQKLRRFGHRRPLVYTGTSRSLARIRDVRSTSKGARVVIHARGLNRRNPNSQTNPAQEIRTISPREQVILTEVLDKALEHRLQRSTTQMTTNIRS